MIHYTLLPHEEMAALRREYRLRLFIVTAFFISAGVAVGIFALLPSYIFSWTQEQEILGRVEKIQESRRASGADQIEKELLGTQTIAKRILVEGGDVSFNRAVERIVAHRSSQLSLNSFTISNAVVGTTTAYQVVVKGRALTRDALLGFKQGLETDPAFIRVDLPLSDLAQSKNIQFSLKFALNPSFKE